MPTHIRAHVQWQVGSMLPRDIMQITPCFRVQADWDPLGGTDWDNLATDLLNAVNTWAAGPSRQLTVKLYDIEGTPVNRPKSVKTAEAGISTEFGVPREIALCLSFSGGNKEAHQRGRVYIPAGLVFASLDVRPDATQRQKVGDLAPLLAGLGGVNVDWIVWSPTRGSATRVDNWYVDDEWDAQRRRGLKPGARLTGTTGG